MIKVAGVRFSTKGRMYYFKKNDLRLKQKMEVIVETERGLQYGFVVKDDYEMEESKLVSPLKNIVRIASKYDRKNYDKNLSDSKYALKKARQLVSELKLEMKFLDANYTFDRKQLLFNFIADERVDFRELAKRLAQIYKTRIELRQIGIRDKAKEIGGIGPCGRMLCCNTFLTDLNSVTINMAKNQMLALNPTKINGVCGRLLCCLNYEDPVYTRLKENLPEIGDYYKDDKVEGKVINVEVLKQKIEVEDKNKNIVEVYIKDGND